MQYRGRLFTGRHVTSRQDVTCRSYRGQGASRHVTSRHVTSGRHRRRRGQGGRHVTSRHVTSRENVTGRRRGQGGRHVTSRQDITGAAVDKEAVTSRHVRTSQAPTRQDAKPSRHVTSRHVTSRRQAPPERTMLSNETVFDVRRGHEERVAQTTCPRRKKRKRF